MWPYFFEIAFILIAQEVIGEPHIRPSSASQMNSTLSPHEEDYSLHNATDATFSTILRDLPTIKNLSIFICVLTTLLIMCLVIKIYRSAKKIRKTRKYDIITTPAARVEMAPLNDGNDDDDDSALFDVKYR
ncbi:membrane protein FAM174B-like [Myxocyprinus asiaticus]|uniref:membrane protein FAM174B-like n=1 Tax=Myxocyprinus asiaticus TaxID=70543 RepID=UPI002222E0AA|nr:membrane protein FAM174B-like [Myxocyprinus asiaticus]